MGDVIRPQLPMPPAPATALQHPRTSSSRGGGCLSPAQATQSLMQDGGSTSTPTSTAADPSRLAGMLKSVSPEALGVAVRAARDASGSTADASEAAAMAAISAMMADPNSAQHQMFAAIVKAHAASTTGQVPVPANLDAPEVSNPLQPLDRVDFMGTATAKNGTGSLSVGPQMEVGSINPPEMITTSNLSQTTNSVKPAPTFPSNTVLAGN